MRSYPQPLFSRARTVRTIRTHAEFRIMPTSGCQAIAFSNVDSLFSKVLLGMIGIEPSAFQEGKPFAISGCL